MSKFQSSLLNSIPIPIYWKDENFNLLGCNIAFEKMLGIPQANLIGKNAIELIGSFEQVMLLDSRDAQCRNLPHDALDVIRHTFDIGEQSKDTIIYRTPYYNDSDTFAGMIGIIVDVMKGYDIDNNLFSMVLDLIPLPLAYMDEHGTIIECNISFCDMVGKTREQLINTSSGDVIGVTWFYDEIKTNVSPFGSIPDTIRGRGEVIGTDKTFHVLMGSLRESSGSICTFMLDLVTPTQENEHHNQMLTIINNIDGIIFITKHGKLLTANREAEEHFRFSKTGKPSKRTKFYRANSTFVDVTFYDNTINNYEQVVRVGESAHYYRVKKIILGECVLTIIKDVTLEKMEQLVLEPIHTALNESVDPLFIVNAHRKYHRS